MLSQEQIEFISEVIPENIRNMFTEEHLLIIDWLLNGTGNGAVVARAGSGKTWLGVYIIIAILSAQKHERILYCCFGKKNQEELSEKIKKQIKAIQKELKDATSADTKTIHSMALGILYAISKGKMGKNFEGKYRKIIQKFLKSHKKLKELGATPKVKAAIDSEDFEPIKPAVDLINFSRSQLSKPTPSNLEYIARHFAITLPQCPQERKFLFNVVSEAMHEGFQTVAKEWDFADTLWKVWGSNLRPKQYDWIIVDEAQDLSPAQLEIVRRSLRGKGRLLFVGDPEQAIMGFAGADHRSLERIIDKMQCDVMSLSICYRCPSKILDLAREIVPDIKNAPNAIEGEIFNIEANEIASKVRKQDMILCRTTAPLISLCLSLIHKGIPAKVLGRDIGEGLLSTARNISKRTDFDGWLRFDRAVNKWKEREVAKLVNMEEKQRLGIEQGIRDKAHCLTTIWGKSKPNTMAKLERSVRALFSEDKAPVTLCTVHKAKGLEADNIFIIKPELLGKPPWCRGGWQAKQEMNLRYVAVTRPLKTLTFVTQ